MTEALMSEYLHVIGTIDPALSHTTVATDPVDMSKYRQVMVVLMLGSFTSTITFDAKVQECGTSSGTWTTYTGKAITQMTGNVDNQQVIFNLSSAEVQATTKKWARVRVACSTSTLIAGLVLGTKSRFKEPWTTISYNDLSTVAQIIA